MQLCSRYVYPRRCIQIRTDVCITIILKIIAKVELLIPHSGSVRSHPARSLYNVCDEFLDYLISAPDRGYASRPETLSKATTYSEDEILED